jgi:hypothetical protein
MYGSKRTVVVLVSLLAITALGSGIGASQQADGYVVEQGERCVEVTPLSYQGQSVEAFYGYSLNGTGGDMALSANTPVGLEDINDQQSSLFLYEGPEGVSLVFLHGGVNGSSDGAISFDITGLTNGSWVVQDDPTNRSVERWNDTRAGYDVDWGYQAGFTDGGAFRGGLDGQFEIGITPAFNDAAARSSALQSNITSWRALSLAGGSLQSVELNMSQPVTIRTGTCA